MKIVLIRPNTGISFQITPPLSLGYLSGSLKEEGYSDVEIIDATLLNLSPLESVNKIKTLGSVNIIGIQIYTGSQKWTKEFIGLAKKKLLKTKIIVGGPHISALKELSLEYLGASYGVVGEGEKTIVEFAKFVEGILKNENEVPGLLYKKGNKYYSATNSFAFNKDLDKIPFPDWELIKPQQYFKYMQGATFPIRGKKPIPILTSRGCPYQCTFCSSSVVGNKVIRYRSPSSIIEEIKFLKEKFKIDEIFFIDDNLTMDIERAENIFKLLIKEKIKIHWRAPNGFRLDRLNEKLIKLMALSGCYYVGIGIETGSVKMIKKINKSIDLRQVKQIVNLFHKYKISVSGFFMCGLLEETEKQIEETRKFALSILFDRIQVSIFTPYPGSRDFETIFKSNNKEEFNKKIMEFQENNVVPRGNRIDEKKIDLIQKKFLYSFYFRPRIVFNMIKNLNYSQIKAIFNHPFVQNIFSKNFNYYSIKVKR